MTNKIISSTNIYWSVFGRKDTTKIAYERGKRKDRMAYCG